ncbi:alkaline phosphatase [Salinibacterium sp. dk2585]|uniref:alkaline phosphatase n=1 Tax=unclassified Salinibacterium TaxID=2632331 RepID=UPI0011C2487D|nr:MULTISPECIES: alkaline phosphatase [unclassified Salinibacterium]QEE60236.1 alkaline phosphatase [Salinibacterium sp. dk2585]TXK55308.1 alkaline phosphatase [Salinibacterium sp. dk5596]
MKSAFTRTRSALAAGTALGVCLVASPMLAATATAQTDAPSPKNIILLISDGGGYNQFDAANLYESGTARNQVSVDPVTGAIERSEGAPMQVYDEWPVQVGQSHFSANGRASYTPEQAWGDFDWVKSGATDSAAAATALGTGVKTKNGAIGYDAEGKELLTLGEQVKAVGKAAGLVTSVPFNHATPAGFIAHNADRNDYQGLATEMIDSDLDVIMGGGHPHYTDAHTTRPAKNTWISADDFARVSQGQTPYSFIDARSSFEALAAAEETPERVFGLAQVAETLQYNRPGLENDEVLPGTDPFNDVPSLATMTKGALNVLDQDEDGFFLMVEGGAIDWAGHANQTTRTIEEQIDFNDSVEAVNAWVEANSSWEETLVIVTADHETGYLAGPGAGDTWTPMTGGAGELPDVTWHSGSHTNQLVPLFARGAGAEQLEARATSYDSVRGAYLDNTDVGEVIFDFVGYDYSSDASAAGLEARVAAPGTFGTLSLSVAEGVAAFEGNTATLPEVTVRDSRGEVQALGKGWTVSGTSSDLVAGNRVIEADNLRWAPKVLASEGGAQAGPAATLEGPATLAVSDRTSRVGETVLGADLTLEVPADARAGRYGSDIVLTVFPTD